MKLTEDKLRSLIKEEALKLQEENLYELTAEEIVKIVYGDEDQKVYSHIKNIASKLGLADSPIRRSFQEPSGGRTAFGGPQRNAQNIKKQLRSFGFDENEIAKVRDAFADAAQRAGEATKQKYPETRNAFGEMPTSFPVYVMPSPHHYPRKATKWFHSRLRFLAKKNLEQLSFIK